MKFRTVSFLLVICSVTFFSCEEKDPNADACNLDSRICTEEFRTITLEITTPDGDPVVLDDFYTFYDSKKRFEYELNANQEGEGIYPVITDAALEELDSEGTVLIFVGEKDDKNVVEHQMFIGHDCCHVILIEGDDEIIVEE